MNTTQVRLTIHGLGCGGGGSLTVEQALACLPAVTRVYVNPLTEQAYIDCAGPPPTWEVFQAAVARAGFRATPVQDGVRSGP